MAKKPTSYHGQAKAAFVSGQITREQYISCCQGLSFVEGSKFYEGDDVFMGWLKRPLRGVKTGDDTCIQTGSASSPEEPSPPPQQDTPASTGFLRLLRCLKSLGRRRSRRPKV